MIEPGHFRFNCHGERVIHLEISLGYQHRGIERALRGGPHKAQHASRRDHCRRHHRRARDGLLPAHRGAFQHSMPGARADAARRCHRTGADRQPYRRSRRACRRCRLPAGGRLLRPAARRCIEPHGAALRQPARTRLDPARRHCARTLGRKLSSSCSNASPLPSAICAMRSICCGNLPRSARASKTPASCRGRPPSILASSVRRLAPAASIAMPAATFARRFMGIGCRPSRLAIPATCLPGRCSGGRKSKTPWPS